MTSRNRALWKLVHQNVRPPTKTAKVAERVTTKFIAWDGEGMGDGKNHRYVLLMNSEGDIIQDEKGLSTRQCNDFFCEISNRYKGQKVVHVCFAASYDVNMLLRDILYNNGLRLQRTGALRWQETYVIQYVPHKTYSVSRYPEGEVPYRKTEKGSDAAKPLGTFLLWDVFSFFQGSFLKALKECFSEEERTTLQYDKIAAGKARRSGFTVEELNNGYIVEYTTLEVAALVALMERLETYCLDSGIKLKRWDGAGAVASALLDKHDILQFYPESIPEEVMIASQHAFGGGRAEQFRFGYLRNTKLFHVDRNSAYPSAMVHLCNLASGNWVTSRGSDIHYDCPMSLYKVRWNFSSNVQPFYPFFYRDPWFQISYPMYGYNWVWWPEMMAARKWNPDSCFEVEEQLSFYPDTTIKPYEFIYDLYKRRQQLKAEKNGMQMVYKLGYNSFYGKTVQRIGYQVEKGNKPKYFQLQYGGWTTSHCRGAMYDAMMQHPENVIAVATDGFWSTTNHDLPLGNELNQWEYEELTGGTFVQSGVYWAHELDGSVTHHSRGMDKDAMQESMILDAWKMYTDAGIYEAALSIPSTRFVTLGSAIASKERFENVWRTWDHTPRNLQLFTDTKNSKRERLVESPLPHLGLVPTKAAHTMGFIMGYEEGDLSQKHPLPWDKEGIKEREEARAGIEAENAIAEEVEMSQM